ncbi:Disease resistance protein L6 [Linum perenne]
MMIWEAFITLGALMLPLLILICNFLIRKWSSNSSSNASQQSESTGIVDSSDSTLPSDASLALSTGEYEVFLSFRGPDTRREITDVLYHFLVRSKIRTFKDDEDLRVGEGIWPSLVEAIKDSKIYVPIFSETYAHSKWCLKELAEMIECQKQHKRHIILPIFYKVDPGDVRKQTGPYEEAFKQHRKNFDDKTIQNWKDALKEVGQLKGWHVTNNDGQGAIADAVFEVIWSHLSKNYELMTDELVGIDGHVKAVVERLDLDSKGVIMVGIHGIGGIGKTTIATAVFNKICAHFDRYCFVDGVRETLQQRDGMIALQNKIISSAAKKVSPVSNASEGIRMIRDRVSQYKVLIVLDDVDDKFKFDNILGKFEHFVSSSRFIITSRNTKVLTSLRCCKLYEVGEMSFEHSLQLFCKHAFRKDYPPHDYRTLSRDILSTTGGLPLTIKVVGSLLFQEEKDVWEEKLVRLQEMPEMEVFERLKISYDALEYEAKQIFLDIACFYVGTDKEIASYMWSDCKFYPVSSISVLIQRSIIKIGDKNEFKMHDQLRDMGKAIVREEDIEHPWMRSRIWSDDDAFELLVGKKGTDRVKAVRANSSSPEICQLTNEHFRNLSDLRYLDGNSTELTGDFNDLLDNLRWLQLHYHEDSGDRLKNFHMNKLVILDLRGSDITDDWGGWIHIKMARKLKVLDLSYCRFITKVPDLSTHGSLEHLHLYAVRGTTQDLNIGNVKNIKVLNLENCRIRKIVGGNIGTLQQLRELNVSSCKCENLGLFLADISTLPSLKILKALKFKEKAMDLPASLKEITTSSSVANLPDLTDLEHLRFEYCDDVGLEFPGDKWLKLSKLKSLAVLYASNIRTIGPQLLPPSLTELHLSVCPKLECLPNFENLENLIELSIYRCSMLRKIEGCGGRLKSLTTLKIDYAESLIHINILESLVSLTDLRKIEILRCPLLTDIFGGIDGDDQIHEFLQELEVGGCTLLEKLPNLSKFPSLRKLGIWDMKGIMKLDGLESLEGLRVLELSDLPFIESLPRLSKLRKLELLVVSDMHRLREVQGIEDLESLEQLLLPGCTSLEKLPDLSGLKSLQVVNLRECSNLNDLSGLNNLQGVAIERSD